jgi:hypothetical protein
MQSNALDDSSDYWSQLDAPVQGSQDWDTAPVMADAATDWLRFAEQSGYHPAASGDSRIDYAVSWARLRDKLAGMRDDDDDLGAPETWLQASNDHGRWLGVSGYGTSGPTVSLPGHLLKPFDGLKEGFDRLR